MYLDLNTSYKRKMKKIFVIIFAIVISLSFTMCGTDDSDISGSEDPTTQKNQFEMCIRDRVRRLKLGRI